MGVASSLSAVGSVKRSRQCGCHLQLATGEHARAVAINQDGQQGRWMMCLGATTGVLAGQVREIESINDFNDEASQVVLREPIVHRRGH